MKKSLHTKTGDRVVVLQGKDKGKIGNVKKVDTTNGKVLVEGVNMVTKAQKANPMAGIEGGLKKIEASIDSSNVMVVCPACEKATRIKNEIRNDKKVRVCKKCGESLDV
ncbi:MAG: 50S ribosomal protein L24 [Candidatus Gastranaerophilales bacterium]|nr:50S ribosomal protein L24 [Candidatus Gastranaerophilales bacterium]